MSEEALQHLQELGARSIRELESEHGILASGRNEAYGCLFGRDSLVVALELLAVRTVGSKDAYYLELVEKILRSLASLQGQETNIESGEEPGKIIHEYRPTRHEHLTAQGEEPWYVYPQGEMRNYDSVDATPLFLIAAHEFAAAGGSKRAVRALAPAVHAALEWLLQFEGFVSYGFPEVRRYGGLRTQSWMDSTESVFYEQNDTRPPYPIAPLEVQAYAWAALKRWGREREAAMLKEKFNNGFVLRGPRSLTLAFALDGAGAKLAAPRSSMGHVLWAAFEGECILAQDDIEALRRRLLSRDLFVPKAGIRTLSSRSLRFDPQSYHNGSIWPHDTAMLAVGLENFGYHDDARRVRDALLNAYLHFDAPIELFAYTRGIREYAPKSGHRACRTQAWSAAALLNALAYR